jgi:Glycosyl-hydrolase 97 N-terminal
MRRRRSRLGSLPVWLLASLAFLGARSAAAQDELRVVSPGGQVEFRLFVSQPGSGPLPQLAYEIRHRGRTAVKTSFLGLQIHNQEPMLGEKVGLVASNTGEDPGRFRWLKADYMQNGSLGRLITVEARVWDDAVAFRYLIPRSAPLEELLIENDVTEFDVAGDSRDASLSLPAVIPGSDGGWIGISEVPSAGFPGMSLARAPDGVLVARLPRGTVNPLVAFEGRTPLVYPWRVLTFAAERDGIDVRGRRTPLAALDLAEHLSNTTPVR